MRLLKRYRLFLLILLFDALLLMASPARGTSVFKYTWANFAEMLSVLPPIFVLLGLLDVWVPRETVVKYVGEGSGIKGIALSILMGAAAAGPLYGAFPVAAVMAKKGAKYSNIIVFLGAWSTLKIPMAIFEMSALGARFALTRWLVNVPGIILMALVIDRLVPQAEKAQLGRETA